MQIADFQLICSFLREEVGRQVKLEVTSEARWWAGGWASVFSTHMFQLFHTVCFKLRRCDYMLRRLATGKCNIMHWAFTCCADFFHHLLHSCFVFETLDVIKQLNWCAICMLFLRSTRTSWNIFVRPPVRGQALTGTRYSTLHGF